MPNLRRKDPAAAPAAGVFISERDPERQLKRAVHSYRSGLIKCRERLEKAIAAAEKIEEKIAEAAKN